MVDRTTNSSQMHAYLCWMVTVALYIVAGVVTLYDTWKVAGYIANVACGSSAFAAVMHVRWYSVRVADLIRSTATPPPSLDGGKLHRV